MLAGIASLASIQPRPAASQATAAGKADLAPPKVGGASAAPQGAEAALPLEPEGAPAATGAPAEGEEGGDAPTRAFSPAPSDPTERARWLERELNAAVAARPALAGAKLGAIAVDLSSNVTLWQHQAEVPLSLASTAKLFTAAAALRALGPGHVWRTALYGEEAPGATAEEERDDTIETLYLRGRGDPGLDAAALRTLAIDLADRGIRRIRKQIVLDASYFDDRFEPPHFDEQPKERAAFRSPVSGLSVNRNAVTLIVTPDPAGIREPTVRLEPAVDSYFEVISDELVATPDGKTRIKIDVTAKKTKVELRLSGQVRSDGPPFYRRVRIDDPVAFAGATLRAALAERGIRAPSRISVGEVPEKARLLVAFDSPTLAEVVRRMNKTSDNFVAEVVFKTLGAGQRTTPGPATWDDAAAGMRAFVASLGLPSPVRVDNGSGLFDASAASASQVVALLGTALRDFHIGPEFLASLPIGGVDGTLQSRFRGRPAAGLVRAKTGTLAQVSALAGYVALRSDQVIGFAVLVNDLKPSQRREARALQEDLVDVMALYLGAPPAAAGAPPAAAGAPPAATPK